MIGKAIFWNIRFVKYQKAFERLWDLNKRHKYNFIALMEPFQGPQELEQYKRKLGMDNAYCNSSYKIWLFWVDDWKGQVVRDNGQYLTVKFSRNSFEVLITTIYARCAAIKRLELWEELEVVA
ncbi:hypothetical protein R3W88_029909 [Solanum pinnatisectum]|uniref:Uncharacterized protein n=1 Tax=Solanum pinnatisectum TaxID=50273 RepID=A0AAV9K6X2_9SOLN|nr:hypothetical protein R3W88_029909 [Solanum pinnatisectum]